MLGIDRFLLYIPMLNGLTDKSLNGYVGVDNGLSATSNKYGVSNKAFEWGNSSDRLAFNSSVGNAIANAFSSEASVYFNAKFTTLSGDVAFRPYHQYGTSGQYAFICSIVNGYGSFNKNMVIRNSDDGTNISGIVSDDNEVSTDWDNWQIDYEDNSTDVDMEFIKNGVSVGSGTGEYSKNNSNIEFRLGALNGGNTQGNFGKMNNFMISTKKINATERAYINKFDGFKEVA